MTEIVLAAQRLSSPLVSFEKETLKLLEMAVNEKLDDNIERELKVRIGDEDFKLFETTLNADWQSWHNYCPSWEGTAFERVMGLFQIVMDCKQEGVMLSLNNIKYVLPDELRRRIELYKWFSGNNLLDFYNPSKGIDMFQIGNYQLVIGSTRNPECVSGIDLKLSPTDNKSLASKIYVGGVFNQKNTRIYTIQGCRGSGERDYSEFRTAHNIHPANFTLLLFLKLSQLLGANDIKIRGLGNHDHTRNTTPSFYLIPRDYFRLHINLEINFYLFDGTKRDTILTKFAGKNEAVSEAFNKLESYVNSLSP